MKFVAKRDLGCPVNPGHKQCYEWIKPYIKNKKILDIGCWTGPMEELLKDDKCHLTAIDTEIEPLKIARKRFPQFKFDNKSILNRKVFKKNEFDVVLFFMVLEHIPKGTEEMALKNINGILKKGGNLFLTTMSRNIFSILGDPAYFLAGHRHYNDKYLKNLLKKTGFDVKSVKYNGGFYTILFTYALYFYKHILRRGEPKGLVEKLMSLDYKDKGFYEIDIRAQKVEDVKF